MSRREDVLFCKLAISNGLITQDQAQKALGLCDKREIETGKRPPIGNIFTKHNLIDGVSVKKIYGAVEKRLGVSVRAEVGQAKGGRRGPGAARRAQMEPALEGKVKKKPMDPATLWMGIGGLVVFLLIICVMLFLVLRGGEEKPKKDARMYRGDKDATAVPSESTPAPKQAAGAPAAKAESAKSAEAPKPAAPVTPPVPAGPKKLGKLDQEQLDGIFANARRGDSPHELKILHALKKKYESQGIEISQDINDFLAKNPEPTDSASEGSTDSKDSAKDTSKDSSTDSSSNEDNLPDDPNPGKESVNEK